MSFLGLNTQLFLMLGILNNYYFMHSPLSLQSEASLIKAE